MIKKLKAEMMRPTRVLEHNANVVLKLIRSEQPISRAEIARKLDVSKSSISNIITYLSEMDLVSYYGKGETLTGRKSELLIFNPRSHYFFSVDLRFVHRQRLPGIFEFRILPEL